MHTLIFSIFLKSNTTKKETKEKKNNKPTTPNYKKKPQNPTTNPHIIIQFSYFYANSSGHFGSFSQSSRCLKGAGRAAA